MTDSKDPWLLDPRLKNDTFALVENDKRSVLLMNDKRWPWLITVPKVSHASELFDLDEPQRAREMEFAAILGQNLRKFTACDKINIGLLGIIVRQLHIHIIARTDGDANWPNPVWGYGTREPYSTREAQDLVSLLKENVVV